MRRFLYYFPGVPGMNPAMLAARGALDRFSVAGGNLIEHQVRMVADGPAGTGVIVAPGTQPPSLRQDLHWNEFEKFWLAIEEFAPGPEDMARPIGLEGYELKLGDGNFWRVPLVHKWDPATHRHVPNVPTHLYYGARGSGSGASGCISKIRAEYAAVDAIATRIFDGFCAGATVSLEQAMRDSAALLSVNYRVGLEEISLLGLIDASSARTVLGCAVDEPAIQRHAAELQGRGVQEREG